MNNLVAVPVLLPLATGILLLFLHGRVALQRIISIGSALGSAGVALFLISMVRQGGIQAAQAGGWAAPYGITLAVDLLSGMMITLSAVILITVLIFAFRDLDADRERTFFHPVAQFLLVGLNLSFVTGDLFNLFVAFEVMLISSYYLLTLGGSPGQLREGFKYLVLNATASTLFLMVVALLYGVTGTLNMADLAEKAASRPGEPLLTLIGIGFLIVFGMKGALFPLYFWLPRSYVQAPSAIAALFAAMLTKVGIYALVRVFTLIFVHDVAYTHTILLGIAGLTMLVGILGAVSANDVKAILSYNLVSHVGYITMGLGLLSRLSLAGAVHYMAHHIIVMSALFLVAGIIGHVTGTTNLKRFSGLLATHPGLGYLFLGAAISLAGIPPFSGFFAKFALIRAGIEQGSWVIVTVSLVVSLLTLFSMVKIFRLGFWGEPSGERVKESGAGYAQRMFPALVLLGFSVAMGFGARYVTEFALAASDQLLHPEPYIRAVFGR